jgi:hypothetical protein
MKSFFCLCSVRTTDFDHLWCKIVELCRGKLQKMGVLYIHSPQMACPSPNFFKIPKQNLKNPKVGILYQSVELSGRSRQATAGQPIAGNQRSLVGHARVS